MQGLPERQEGLRHEATPRFPGHACGLAGVSVGRGCWPLAFWLWALGAIWRQQESLGSRARDHCTGGGPASLRQLGRESQRAGAATETPTLCPSPCLCLCSPSAFLCARTVTGGLALRQAMSPPPHSASRRTALPASVPSALWKYQAFLPCGFRLLSVALRALMTGPAFPGSLYVPKI